MGITAAFAVTAAGYAAGAAAVYEGYKAVTSKSKSPNIPAPPQAGQVPDANGNIGRNAGMGQSGGNPGVAQTFLTGPGGIDPSLLNLGKTTLLGGSATGG